MTILKFEAKHRITSLNYFRGDPFKTRPPSARRRAARRAKTFQNEAGERWVLLA
jgi:hypothetical protein